MKQALIDLKGEMDGCIITIIVADSNISFSVIYTFSRQDFKAGIEDFKNT